MLLSMHLIIFYDLFLYIPFPEKRTIPRLKVVKMTALLTTFIYFAAILQIPFINGKFCTYKLGRKYKHTEDCTKLEHCKNKTFDATSGACRGPGNQCEPGWMGPGCQYVNLAYQTSKRDSAIDGLLSTSRGIRLGEGLHVTLPGVFIVSAVNIFCVSKDNQTRVRISVKEGIAVYDGPLQVDSTVYLKHPVRTKELFFSFDLNLTVKEIEVFGGKNVALWKETSQSSTYESSSNYASHKAVDGWDGNHDIYSNTCIHTQPGREKPFWGVMLGGLYRILSVYISNRGDRSERINGFTVHVKTASGEERLIYTDKEQNNRNDIWIDSSYMPNELVNEVIIRGDYIDHEKIINLCEFYALACIPSKNGTSECTQLLPENCHPSFDRISDNLACPACLSGWTGDYCDIKKEQKYCNYHKGRTIDNKGNCTRKEHCLGKFRKSDGQCSSPKNQCEPGWMGPGCQYVNLAYRSSNSRKSLDGSLNTSEQILETQIEFTGSFIISALIIHGKESNNVTIKTPNNETCYTGNIKEGSPIVFCNFILRTKRLIISFVEKQTVLEIEVFGGRNVALWKKTSQSSDYKSVYTSDKAVDGWDSGGDFSNNSCSHTDEKNKPNGPYWNVNLGSPYSVMSVRIANRKKYEQRINGFRLFGLNFTNPRQLMYKDPGNATSRSSVWVDSSFMRSSLYHTIIIDGEYLVKYKSRYKILALCEVEVFACRLTENAEENCVSFCPKNCQQTETCLNENFTCPKCNPGWEGPHCTQVVSCKRPDVAKRNLSLSPDFSSYEFNTTIHFTCPEGFIILGYTQAVCGPEGIFINNNRSVYMHPSCEAITCSSADIYLLDIIKTPSKLTYNYNERINFSCTSGYSLQKPTTAVCKKDGLRYTDGSPNCIGKMCNTCSSFVYFIAFTNSISFTFLEIQCNSSTVKSSNLSLDPLEEIYAFNVTITFSCKKGYNLNGSKSGKCLQNNVFVFMPDNEKPYCEAITCNDSAVKVENLLIDALVIYKYNQMKEFKCKEGFINNGSKMGTCKTQDKFEFSSRSGEPFCQEKVGHFQTIIAALTGGILCGIGILVFIFITLMLLRRKSKIKTAANACPQDNEQMLSNLDNQYAAVDPLRKKTGILISDLTTEINDGSQIYENVSATNKDNLNTPDQNVYYEFLQESKPSETAIKLSLFKDHVETRKRENKFFSNQFKKFYNGLQFPATAAVASGNKSKNKYKHIYPYDETRVKLNIENDPEKSDFINASYIHGYGKVKAYIAAQGPLVDTIDDFWSLVWNENCGKIVMLTNLKENNKIKCVQYWPEKGLMKKGELIIEVVDTEEFADFIIRTFCIKKENKQRIIRHFHFTAWPDKGVPLYASSLVHFHSKVKNTVAQGKGPMVVHCSAGIGRTGSFIALDVLIQQAKESGSIEVFRCVETLRRQRVNMVQTLEQYIFLHDALVKALMCTSSDPSTTEFSLIYQDLMTVDPKSGKRKIDQYYENTCTGCAEIPQAAYDFAKKQENRRKNRYSNILPIDTSMPQIWDEKYKPVYINAVFLPAYKNRHSFIATQMPLRETVVDFWRLVHQQHVSTIVLLGEVAENISESKQNIGKYWPEATESIQYGPFTVTKEMSTGDDENYSVINLIFSLEKGEERMITLFKCNFWRDSETIPPSISPILNLINDVEMHHNKNNTGPVVVQCLNGAEKTGLFCVLQVVLERMKIEKDVAIHQVVQHMRSVRPNIISNVEQFKFCYDAVMEFMKQYDAYSNFQ